MEAFVNKLNHRLSM